MSKLPISDASVRIIPSLNLKKVIFNYLSCDSITTDGIKHACEKKLSEYSESRAISEDASVQFMAHERRFLEEWKKGNIVKQLGIIKSHVIDNDQPEMLLKPSDQLYTSSTSTLSLVDLKMLFQVLNVLREENMKIPYLHELMKDSEIILPENEIQQRNPLLEARCQKLRKEQESREYQAMTRNVDNVRKHAPQDTISFQMKQINRQLIAVAQFIFSVAAGFAFGFIGVELIIGQLDFGFRLLLGIMIALIIALAEIYFLAKKLNEEYESSKPQNASTYSNIKEREIVESIRIPLKASVSKAKKVHND